jgi:L,D-peptidoglycan transpeptidase YkuD (ErfK/YbiS/YcfS/YnhG family)
MRTSGAATAAIALLACGVLALAGVSRSGAGDGKPQRGGVGAGSDRQAGAQAGGLRQIPDVGARLRGRIPADTGQVVAVYGAGEDSDRATVELFTRHDGTWHATRSWAAHNGNKGWTTDHHLGDHRSPVGVFTLSDAGGVLPDPGARLPYTASPSFQAPHSWARSYWHDFDYVIAIDYNRVRGTPPTDPTRPRGEALGGGIWLHMDHGSGTSGCVSLSKAGMRYLLRTLDPRQHPVVVMGDRADLMS